MQNRMYRLAHYKNILRISHKVVRCYTESVKCGIFGVKSLFHNVMDSIYSFCRWISWRRALAMEHLSLWELLCWRPCRLWKEGSGNDHLSSWGLSWATRSGDFETWLKGAVEVGRFYWSSVKGTWREGSLAGDPGVWAPLLGTLKDR
jgi:hypothetical protein